jgi:hypothetical protein
MSDLTQGACVKLAPADKSPDLDTTTHENGALY